MSDAEDNRQKKQCADAIRYLTLGIASTGGIFAGMLWNKAFYGQATAGENSQYYTYGSLLTGTGVLALAIPRLIKRVNQLLKFRYTSIEETRERFYSFLKEICFSMGVSAVIAFMLVKSARK